MEGGVYVELKEKNPKNYLSIVFFVEYNEEDQYKTLLFIKYLFEFGFRENSFCSYLTEQDFVSKCFLDYDEQKTKSNGLLEFQIQMLLLDDEKIPNIIQSYFNFIKKLKAH